jgi:hypothetical protein
MRARGLLTALAATAVIALGYGSAGARDRPPGFDGSCSVQGTVTFSPPATNAQQSLDVVYEARGTCSGTLDGRQLSNAPVRMRNAARRVDGSCMHADTTHPGHAAIVFADGTTVRFGSEFHFVGTEGEFTLRSERWGSAHGHGSFLTTRTPPDIALQCAGEGAREAPLDVSLATDR